MNKKNLLLSIVIVTISIVPLIIWPNGFDYYYNPKIISIYFLNLFNLILFIILCKNKKVTPIFSKETSILLLFMLFVILSTICSPYKDQVYFGKIYRREGLFAFLSYFLIFYFSSVSLNTKSDIKRLIKYLLISSTLICIYGIIQYFDIDPIPRDVFRKYWDKMSFSTLGNPNFLGSYLSMIIPLSIGLFINEEGKKNSVYLFIVIIISSYTLILTKTRSSWMGVLLSFIFIFILNFKIIFKNIKKILILILSLIIIIISLNYMSNGYFNERIKSIGKEFISLFNNKTNITESLAGGERIFIWARSIDYIFNRPLTGSGPDTFDKVFKMSIEESLYHFNTEYILVDKAHNEYLQILITLGFPALFLYLLFLSLILAKSFIILKKENNIYLKIFLPVVISYLVQAFFNISVVSVAPVFYSILGITEACINKNFTHIK